MIISRHEQKIRKDKRSLCKVMTFLVSDHNSKMGDKDEPQMYKKRYKIDKKLGAGNFGTAYLVTDLKSKTEP